MRWPRHHGIEALDATARSKRSILIVDARTLAPFETIHEPGPSATSSWYELQADWSIGDGDSLVVRWANAVSVTDLHSGTTWQFPLAQPGHDFKGKAREAGRIAWRVDDRISIWDSHTKQLRSFEATGCSKGYGVSLSPDGARVAVGCTKSVAIWDAASEQLIQRIAVVAYDTWNPRWLSAGRARRRNGRVGALGRAGLRDRPHDHGGTGRTGNCRGWIQTCAICAGTVLADSVVLELGLSRRR